MKQICFTSLSRNSPLRKNHLSFVAVVITVIQTVLWLSSVVVCPVWSHDSLGTLYRSHLSLALSATLLCVDAYNHPMDRHKASFQMNYSAFLKQTHTKGTISNRSIWATATKSCLCWLEKLMRLLLFFFHWSQQKRTNTSCITDDHNILYRKMMLGGFVVYFALPKKFHYRTLRA